MKIATWNVNGIRARETQFAEWLEAERPDVICLQEIKASPDKVPESICSLEGYSCYWHGGERLFRRRTASSERSIRCGSFFDHPAFDMENRIVTATMGDLVIASVYVPNGGKDFTAKMQFFSELDSFAATLQSEGRRLVICGDLNIAREERDVHPKERKLNTIGQLPEERELFARLLSRGLVDLGRYFAPDNDDLFTWWAPWRNLRQRNIGWRIDYVLVSESLARTAIGCTVQPQVGTSDHAPVVATFEP